MDTFDKILVPIWPNSFFASCFIDFNFTCYHDQSTICCGIAFLEYILLYFHFTKEISFVRLFQNLDSLIKDTL